METRTYGFGIPFKENPKQLNKIGTTTYEYLQDPITHKILFLEGTPSWTFPKP
jgi:hypothetical protein